MAFRSLVPFRGTRNPGRRLSGDDPFTSLRREMDELFEDFLGGSGLARWPETGRLAPPLDVSEDDKTITVSAELPGVEEKDIDVSLSDGLLTISAEKSAESERKDDHVHMSERSYGSYSRSIRLPFDVDEAKVEAAFKNGVLTVSLPKPPEVQRSAKKIEVKSRG